MGIITTAFVWLVTIADAIIYAVISFFGVIIIIIAFAMADGDDYWAEGGMSLPENTKIESSKWELISCERDYNIWH